jgi:WD40 repeat protein
MERLSVYDQPKREFFPVGGKHLERMEVIAEIFNRILTPLYGSQEKAIGQIRESRDRSCFLLYEDDCPKGVLVFKTVLSDEYADVGVTKSVEVKSLFVDNSVHNSGKGLGSALVDKLKEEVEKLDLNHSGIHVTVSETKEESLMFFRKKGFSIAHAWQDRYIKGVTEYLLSCPARIAEAAKAASPVRSMGPVDQMPELLHIIHNAHLGDIHALQKLSDGTFVSASKDNCLYKWDERGKCVKVVSEVEPELQTERSWVTAVKAINDAYFVSGTRDGKVYLWKTNGEYVKEVHVRQPGKHHVSMPYNLRRVNCLAAGLDPHIPSFFVGFPTTFDEYNLLEGKTTAVAQAHANDWVYCIHPLSPKRLLTVIGCTVDLWEKADAQWQRKDNLLPEGPVTTFRNKGKPKRQRAFISSLVPVEGTEHHIALSLFEGSIKVLDIVSKTLLFSAREHEKRVWTVQAIGRGLLASGGEDRTIKLWDLRSPASICTLPNHLGEVTALSRLGEFTFLAGTCPPDVVKGKSGAEIRFYDIRQLR